MKTLRKVPYLVLVFLGFALMICVVVAEEAWGRNISPELVQLLKDSPQRETYVQAGAVILLKERKMTIGKDGLSHEIIHIIGKILNEHAKEDYGQIVLSFSSYFYEASLDYARTISPDGKIAEVSPDATQIKTDPNVSRYTDMRLLTFSFKGLEVGSHFEYQATRRQKTPLIEHRWVGEFDFNYMHWRGYPRIDPVYESRFVLKIPEGEEFVYQVNRLEVSPKVQKEEGALIYIWEVKDLPPIPIEENMPSADEMIPEIYFSSVKGWEEIDSWASERFLARVEVTPEVQAKAQELTHGANTDEEKIAALFHFIQTQIEYLIANLGLGGYMPHAPQEILTNRYGDCKDQVTLFLSLLKAMGIPAYPALINPFPYRKVIKKIPSPHFPHLIAYIPRDGADIWLDTTSSVTGFPNLHWTDQNRWALVIDGKGGKFLKTPSSQPQDNQATVEVHFTGKDQTLKGKMSITGTGGVSDNLKFIMRRLQDSQRDESWIREIVKRIHLDSQIQKIEWSDLDEPKETFKVIAWFEVKDVLKEGPPNFTYGSNAMFALELAEDLQNLPLPDNRKQDFLLGVKFQLVSEEHYSPPAEDFRPPPGQPPPDETLDNSLLSLQRTFKRDGNSIKARWELTMKQNRIQRKDYKEFYETIEEARKKTVWQVTFTRQKIDKEGIALEKAVKEKPEEVPSLVKLARHYLTRGKYEEAKELLEKVVNLDPNSGEVRYFFGMALTYLEQYEEGAAEMEKAEELGYEP